MTPAADSITRRLIVAVLILELLAGITLIAAVAANERRIQYKAFDANLRATSNGILGAVQEGAHDQVRLDLAGQSLPPRSILRVTDEQGRTLGAEGTLPALAFQSNAFTHAHVDDSSYRFFTLVGEKVFDPEDAGGIHHQVKIIYGLPDGRVMHQVIESIRFFASYTIVLLGITSLLLVWLARRLLYPIHELASAASEVSSDNWHFDPPASAHRFAELRPLASAIETTICRLQRALQVQKRFTSDAAHELKTDVAIVKSSLQLLAMKPRTPAEYERGLAAAQQDVTRLEHTVQKMLTLARVEQAPAVAAQPCRMDEVLRAVMQQSAAVAALHRNSILSSPLPVMRVSIQPDDAMLLCSNIVMNALQHSPEGGSIEISGAVEGDRASFSVLDHGDGIAEDDAHLLFAPFYRGDPSRSRDSGGTGLGLSICKAICDRTGGEVAIANHAGGGAIVTVTLPVEPIPNPAAAMESSRPRR